MFRKNGNCYVAGTVVEILRRSWQPKVRQCGGLREMLHLKFWQRSLARKHRSRHKTKTLRLCHANLRKLDQYVYIMFVSVF